MAHCIPNWGSYIYITPDDIKRAGPAPSFNEQLDSLYERFYDRIDAEALQALALGEPSPS